MPGPRRVLGGSVFPDLALGVDVAVLKVKLILHLVAPVKPRVLLSTSLLGFGGDLSLF